MNDSSQRIGQLEGPIAVFGAGGFIGINLLNKLISSRKDVIGVSQSPRTNWRILESKVPKENLAACDITDYTQLRNFLAEHKPKTIFNLAAYGGYSSQREYKKIYATNFNAALDLLEIVKSEGLACYIHAGSSSEYGTNSCQPIESDELSPNSHYAVSKVASSYAIKYYGQIEKLPVVNLRIYSAYGPWEEPDRLIPALISSARNGTLPEFVNESISRDFVYIDDVCNAFVAAATNIQKIAGNSYNIGSGIKTTIRDLAFLTKDLFRITEAPRFGTMSNRRWDLPDWYANPQLATRALGWRSNTSLSDGILKVADWQKSVDYETAYWNIKRK